MTTQLILFSTSSCHLCEEAAAILENLSSLDISWHEIDIAEDDELLAIYGRRIPVLRHTDSGREINWPFTQHDASLLIDGQFP
ncbi:MAG: glutaredoxin family protein [Methylophilaceae bacterium]|nr:glutaredoxin family protein [Methylophilaceae bacterium]